MKARTKREVNQILKQVQAHLDAKRDATGIALAVPKGGYHADDGWLTIIVSPAAKGIRAYDYVEALSDVEKELREEGLEQIVLVPAMAD